MAGFKKAKAEQAALKIGLYGLPGSGKTFSSLLMAEGLALRAKKRIAYIDTERGTDFYALDVKERTAHPAAFDFDALYTRSIVEVGDEIRKLDTSKYGVVVLDSVTHLWEATKAAYKGSTNGAGQIPFHAWGKIKKPYKDLMSFLLSSPLHVFILGRQGTDFGEDENGELKAMGTKMKSESETPYEPHILCRMYKEGQKHFCEVEKDRTGILSGKVIADPSYTTICAPLEKLLGGTQAKAETEDETAAKDSEALEQREQEKEKTGAEDYRVLCAKIALCATEAELKACSKEITPERKKNMSTDQVADLRNKYQERESALKGK